jgi:hypothetical protein
MLIPATWDRSLNAKQSGMMAMPFRDLLLMSLDIVMGFGSKLKTFDVGFEAFIAKE